MAHKRQRLLEPGMFTDEQLPLSLGLQNMPPVGLGGGVGLGIGMGMGAGVGLGLERGFPCVKLRGLPFDVNEDEIRVFLGSDPVDVLLVKRDGRFSGEAYVVLGSSIQVEIAMSKNKSYMGRRYIEVFKSRKLDYYKAVVAEMMDGGSAMTAARPPRQQYHSHSNMQQSDANMSPANQQNAQQGENMQTPGTQFALGLIDESNPVTVLRLRGLPYSCRKEDVTRWFEDPQILSCPLSPTSVHLVTEYGRPTGQAFVEFTSSADANAALTKDRHMMGNRYIEIFPSSREEASRYMSRY